MKFEATLDIAPSVAEGERFVICFVVKDDDVVALMANAVGEVEGFRLVN